ncbi:putative Solute carrier family 12 member 8 [Hypsibius exemplaris]|uniref:Solute carrier family 12 member 8 n=1 Tax=Hypsibius exemplaris TaxID=2072580 RepID=A0A1W0WQI8_HYPEX|nr:putative Solute carrier family 12 member 8 [Hypsibius exemplaris]
METGKSLAVESGAATVTPHGSPARPSGLEGLKSHFTEKDPEGGPRWFAFWKHNFCIRENANFGTWDGVFPTCLAHLLNVIVFLRTGFIVAKAGVLLSFTISIICVLFASGAQSSPRLGSSVALRWNVGMSITSCGFVRSPRLGMGELIVGIYYDTVDHDWAVRAVASGCLLLLTALNVVGIKWIIRAQYIIVILIALGVGDFFVGALFRKIPVSRDSLGIFFPSTVGVLVGFNIAADLRDPHRSIPKGTFAALFCSMGVHFLFILLLGASVIRSYLLEHPHTVVRMAAIQVFIILAIFVSSFASGMGAIFNASRILARIAKETSIPGLRKLDWVWARFQTPLLSVLVAAVFALLFVLIGRINFLAPVITTSHFMTFAVINYAYFALSTTYKLQVSRELTATTQWLQQGLREGRIASPESRSPKAVRSPADRENYGNMTHSSTANSLASERSHLLGSGTGSGVGTPKDPLISAKVPCPVLSKPGDGLLKYHSRWVALISAIVMIIMAFVIQWESALSTVSSLGLIYIVVHFFTPNPSPGIVQFHPLDWITGKISGQPEHSQLENDNTDPPTVTVPEESRFIASASSPSLSDRTPFIPTGRQH